MNEPIRRSMANGPTQKTVKKYRMADSMSTHISDDESIKQAILKYITKNENEELDDETREWLKNKQYPAGENEDNQKSNQT